MNNFNAKIFGGTVAFSTLLLLICMLVFTLIPSNAEKKEEPVNEVPDFALLNSMDFTEEYFAEAGFKTEYADDYSPEDDEGLALYRQPQSRPAVEWFYTHVTSNREVALAILENADKNDIPLSLAFSLAFVESRFKT
ncbi:MAG: lytic transglycosylase, partial [Treponema sp.]|nr:lytic transglycosylase [Treponema sp.]